VMALVNLANILTFYLCGVSASAFGYLAKDGIKTFNLAIHARGSIYIRYTSATLLCRLMLNLHTSADTGLYTKPNTTLTWRIVSAMDNEESWGSSGATQTFGEAMEYS
ncbi:hypothetical protein MPER_06311, partial [Moniliophthora perniciosa FA553]